MDILGVFTCIMVITLGPIPFSITLVAVIFELDATHYLSETVILPDPKQRDILPHIVLPFILRFLLNTIATFEAVRTILFTLVNAGFFVQSVTTGLRFLQKAEKRQFHFYNQLSIICKMLHKSNATITGLFITVGQIETVVCLWCTINGYGNVPSLLMYMLFPIIAMFLIAYTIIMFEDSVGIFEISKDLTVKTWGIGCAKRSKSNCVELKIDREVKRIGRSLRPIPFTIGLLLMIEKGFQIRYLDLLMSNLVNALLLFRI